MANGTDDWSELRVTQVYRPRNTENWFPLDPRCNRVTKNKFVDGLRCEIVHVIRTSDGYAHWKIDNQRLTPNQLVKLERARSRKERVRVAKILVNPNNLKSKGHVVSREILCVNDEPKLEVRQCYATPDETVHLVAAGAREVSEPEPMDYEHEVVIQPVARPELSSRIFAELPVAFIKQEPIDLDEVQNAQSSSELSSVPPLIISENIAPTTLRRSTRPLTMTPPSDKYKVDLPRKRRRRK